MQWGILCMCALLVNLLVSHKLVERLRLGHESTWRELGAPELGQSNLASRGPLLALSCLLSSSS